MQSHFFSIFLFVWPKVVELFRNTFYKSNPKWYSMQLTIPRISNVYVRAWESIFREPNVLPILLLHKLINSHEQTSDGILLKISNLMRLFRFSVRLIYLFCHYWGTRSTKKKRKKNSAKKYCLHVRCRVWISNYQMMLQPCFFLFMPDMCASILCKDTARLTMASFICCLEKSRQNEQNNIERNDTVRLL